ncbi:MAG: ABC transporter permease [Candidatus Krumholzibacteriia bacterium]
MSNVLPILKKELRSYFTSPVAYIVITFFLVFCGVFFAIPLFVNGQASMRGAFSIVLYAFTFFVPAITMRLISEEKKTGTFELLVTMPVSDLEVIVGKYLAAFVLLMIGVGMTATHAITVSALGNVDGGQVAAGYIGLALLGAAYVAVGIWASSFTENQIIAFLVSLTVIFILTFIDKLLIFLPIGGATLFEYLGAEYHFNNIARGVLDTRDLVYYASLIFLGLYFSARALKRRL